MFHFQPPYELEKGGGTLAKTKIPPPGIVRKIAAEHLAKAVSSVETQAA
jgi:hypothetical protein